MDRESLSAAIGVFIKFLEPGLALGLREALGGAWSLFRDRSSVLRVSLGNWLIALLSLGILGLAGVPLRPFPGLGRPVLPVKAAADPWLAMLLSLLLGVTAGSFTLAGSLRSLLAMAGGRSISLTDYFRLAVSGFVRALLLSLSALLMSLALGLAGGAALTFLIVLAALVGRSIGQTTIPMTVLVFLPGALFGLWFSVTILLVPVLGFLHPDRPPLRLLEPVLRLSRRRLRTVLLLGLFTALLALFTALAGSGLTYLPVLGIGLYLYLVQLAGLFSQAVVLVFAQEQDVETRKTPPAENPS